MKFSGLQKVSLVDYPNKVASVLFTPGCNLRCPFCHNWRIVVDPKPPFLQEAVALRILESRKKYVDAIVITGGEPTMHKELPRFLAKLKKRGFLVKLDTNGFYPEVLEECLALVDYVALDLKTSQAKYTLLGAKNTEGLLRTLEMLKTGKVAYEIRTTVVPEIVTADDINSICELAKGAETHALQQFVPQDTLEKRFESLKPYAPEVIKDLAENMKSYVENVVLRI
ncbi:anaerobic ribonucleoside-triphosphate reductase activating protein [Candidatus Bathyarchaeota archaeon]|nr:anaerobic ribonucleoside-triphosphate reductase activating protein [Candidatus Bathyarchaeota archaeon]